jgi:gliding motility-associated-like protein
VNANTLQPGCGAVQLSGLYFPGNITGYYNPPPTNFSDPYLFNNNSNIEICFDIVHPILSDLRIELLSPPACGSQTVVLTSTQTPANADSICYNSDAVNLCFSNVSNSNYNLCELGSENVSGVFGSYGLSAQAIDWSPIQGCDVTQPGWEIHVFDCFDGANGFWESATMTISDDSGNGLPLLHEYFPDAGQDSTILDNSCDGGSFTIIELQRPYPQASLLSQGVGIQWATNPPIELPNNGVGLTLLLDPGPTQDVYFSLSLSNIELGDACGAQSYDVEFFDYIQPDSSVITLTDSILCLTDEPLLLTTTIEEGTWVGPVDSVEQGVIFSPDSVGLYSISFEPFSSCIDRTEVLVRVDQAPILDLPDAQGFCSADTVVVLDASPPNGLWSGVGITDASEGTFDPSLVLSGETILQYTAGINCPASANVSFTVETYIPLQILNADTTVCDQSLPLDLNVNLLNTTWQGEGITSGALGIFNAGQAGTGEHIIVATYNQGCYDTDTVVVRVDDGTLNIESLLPLCEGADTLDLQVEADSGFWFGTGVIDSLQGMVDLALLSPGNNQFYYTLRNSCAFTDSVTLFVEEFIPLQILSNDTAICIESGALNLETNLSLVDWQGTGIIASTVGDFDPLLAGVGEFMIVANYNQACSSSDSISIRVDDGTLTIESLLPLCEGADTLDLQVEADSGYWFGAGVIDSLQGMVDLGLLSPGYNQFYYTLRNACAFTDSVPLFVEEFIPLQILSNDTAICIESGALNLETNLSLVDWQGAGIVSSAAGDFDPFQSGVGEFMIFANYNQACSSSDSISIRVDDGTLTIESLLPLCEGADTLDLQVEADSGFWFGTGVIDSLQGMVDLGLLSPGNNQFYYTLRNACAFTDSVTLFVEEFIPLQILSGDTAICIESGALDLESNLSLVDWQGTGIVSSAAGDFDPLLAGVGEFMIVANYNQACSSADSISIVVDDPTILLQSLSPICVDADAFSLQALQGLGVWSGEGVIDNLQGIVAPSILNPGTHYFTYTLSNSCASSDSVSIEVVDFPVIDLVLPEGICVDQLSINIDANLTGGQFSGNGVEGSNVQWLFNPQQAGVGSALIQYVYTDVCTSTIIDSIEVYPLPILTVAADTSICPEGSAQLFAAGAVQYSWSPDGTLQNPNSAFTEAQPQSLTPYTVVGTSANGCVATEEVLVDVFASPVPTTNGPIEICKGETEALEVTGLVSAQWFGPALDTPGELNTLASPAQSTIYQVEGYDINGCMGDTTLEVIVYEPIAFFSSSDSLGTPPMEVFFENLSEGDFFIWDFGNGDSLVTNDINAPASAIFDDEQFHTITLTAFLNGCPAVYSYSLETYYDSELLVVPNVVSPNGDGKNDTWRVITRNMAEMQVDIFNRWGTLIEQVDGIYDSWDPKDVSAGTYYYRLTATGLDGELYNRDGQITVLTSEN